MAWSMNPQGGTDHYSPKERKVISPHARSKMRRWALEDQVEEELPSAPPTALEANHQKMMETFQSGRLPCEWPLGDDLYCCEPSPVVCGGCASSLCSQHGGEEARVCPICLHHNLDIDPVGSLADGGLIDPAVLQDYASSTGVHVVGWDRCYPS